MNIEQVKKLAKLTRSTSTIELLLDEDEEITKSIVATVDRLDKADVIYTEGSINAFIELVKNHTKKHKQFEEDICTILKAITNKYRTNQEINMNDINCMIKLYIDDNYSINTINLIKNFKPILSRNDFFKLYDALSSVNFEIDLKEYSLSNEKVKSFIPTRTIDEVCKLIKDDNGLSPKQKEKIYFDEDILKYKTYEESKLLGKKVLEAYKSEEYNKKIKSDEHNEKTDIELLATDKTIILSMTNTEHLSLMDEFIKDPSYDLYKILSNRDLLEHRSYSELMKLIELYKENPDTYESIVNHKLLLLPLTSQIECINIILNTKSPYIKDIVLNSDKPITKDTIKELKDLDKPISIQEELNIASIDEFIKSLEDNGIEEFNSNTPIYVKNKK